MSNPKANSRNERPYSGPIFQAFTIKATRGRPTDKANSAVTKVLGRGWTVQNYGGRRDSFEVFKGDGALSPDEAWRLTYLLRAERGIASAEPVFKAVVGDRKVWETDDQPGAAAGPQLDAAMTFDIFNFLCGNGDDFVEAHDNEWSLNLSNVIQAWTHHFPNPNVKPGTGIIIGHPDTGYRKHPEIKDNLLPAQGFDFFQGDNDPTDQLIDGFLKTPGHGTGTASVIISPRGAPAGKQPPAVSGTAPGATLIPFRVNDSVIIVDTLHLAQAIERAADAGAHVISMSMGGLFSDRLHDAVVYAKNKGVIVLAAAGNCVQFVIFPAAYEEVIAVAACDARRGIWRGSSRGAAVDITAPGDRVWHALASANDNDDNVGQGSGTSYAVATVAGIAALWLAHHGRTTLINKYGKEKIASVFMQLLRDTATTVPGWTPGQFGGGLVNADALLNAPLPNGTTMLAMVPTPQDHSAVDRGGTATFSHLFEQSLHVDQAGLDVLAVGPADPRARLNDRLAKLLNTTPDKLPVHLGQVGQELAFHLMTDPDLYRQFAEALSAQLAPVGAAGGAIAAPIAPDANIEAVRDGLLAKGVSSALAARL